MNTNEKTWIVSNGKNKAIILQAECCDIARKKANELFYEPFRNKKELFTCQVLSEDITHIEHVIFKKVQFHALGGVVTTYDGTVRTQPTEAQKDFLNRPILYTKLTNE